MGHIAEGVHCGGDVVSELPSQQFDNFVDFEGGDSGEEEDGYMQACSLGGAADSDDSDMDAEMDKIGEMLLAQTAANAASRSMPLPVDRRKASNSRVKPTPTPTPAAAPKPKPVQKTQVDSELEKLADMLLAQQTAASVSGSPAE